MAVLLVEGFDLYNGIGVGTGVQGRWARITSATYPSVMATGRFGGQSLGLTNSNGKETFSVSLPSSQDRGTIGFAIKTSFSQNTAMNGTHVRVRNGATPQLGLRFDGANRNIVVVRPSSDTASTVLGSTPPNSFLAGTWHYIEFEFVIHDTLGEARVWQDGTLLLSLTNIDTRNFATSPNFDVLEIGGTASVGNGYQLDMDDLYVTDSPARLGERRVETLRPSADTAQKDFSRSAGADNFALVDEATSNGDTDYVQGSVVGNLDRYSITALSTTPTAISAVQISAFALKTDAATRNIALHCRSGETDNDGPNFALAATYTKIQRILEADPAGGAWTSTGVNSLLIGPKVTV